MTHAHRFLNVVLLGLSLLSGGCRPSAEPPMLSGPIILFDIDTLRADHLGCYGYARPTSPNIDRLARESFRFEWAFSQSHSTGPSHSSIFTGLYPSTHGVKSNGARLADTAQTMAESFQAAGYRTAAFVDGGFLKPSFNLNQGFEYYQHFPTQGLETFGPQVLDFLKKYAHLNLFLIVHTYDVHAPYDPPEPFRSMFSANLPHSQGFAPTIRQLGKIRYSAWTDHPKTMSRSDLEYTKACYDGGIRFVDHWIGLFLDELEKLGLDQRATIILMSDHGEAFQEQGFLQHDRLFTPVTRIPLIIRPPGGVDETVISSVVQSIDLMPTLLEGAGLPIPPLVQGRSLMPLLRGERMRARPAVSEAFQNSGKERSIVWKGHQFMTGFHNAAPGRLPGGPMLFDLERDPRALRDVLTDSPQMAEILRGLLAQWQARTERHARLPSKTEVVDDKTKSELQALGYIQ